MQSWSPMWQVVRGQSGCGVDLIAEGLAEQYAVGDLCSPRTGLVLILIPNRRQCSGLGMRVRVEEK